MIAPDLEPAAVEGPPPRRSGLLPLIAGVVAVIVVVGVINSRRAHDQRPVPPAPTPSVQKQTDVVDLLGRPVSVTGTQPLVYALTVGPSRLYRLNPTDLLTPLTWVDVDPQTYLVQTDAASSRLFTLAYRGSRHTVVRELDPLSLTTVRTRTVAVGVNDMLATGNRLYLAADDGLFTLDDSKQTIRPVAGVPGPVRSLALSIALDRLYAGSTRGTTTLVSAVDGVEFFPQGAHDKAHLTVAKRAVVPLMNLSMASTDQAELWVAGRDANGVGGLLRLDPTTLTRRPTRAGLGPFGQAVSVTTAAGNLWLFDGGRLSCVDDRTGAMRDSFGPYSGSVAGGNALLVAMGAGQAKVINLYDTRCVAP